MEKRLQGSSPFLGVFLSSFTWSGTVSAIFGSEVILCGLGFRVRVTTERLLVPFKPAWDVDWLGFRYQVSNAVRQISDGPAGSMGPCMLRSCHYLQVVRRE